MTSGRQRPEPDDLPDEVVFLAKPYVPETVIAVIGRMATLQVVARTSSHIY
jgi:hypothetical protein